VLFPVWPAAAALMSEGLIGFFVNTLPFADPPWTGDPKLHATHAACARSGG
jgi:hypothetical protein